MTVMAAEKRGKVERLAARLQREARTEEYRRLISDVEGGVPIARLARERGLRYGTLYARLLKAGLKVGVGKQVKARDRSEITERYLRGESCASIAHDLGVSRKTIRRRLVAPGQPLRNMKAARLLHSLTASKRCSECGVTQSVEAFYLTTRGSPTSWCRDCTKARSRSRFAQMGEATRNREQLRLAALHTTKAAEASASRPSRNRRRISSLHDTYVALTLGLPVAIARPLIPAKRAHLQIHRELKKRKSK